MSETNDQRIYDRCIIRVGQLEAENESLRELVRKVFQFERAGCEGCPYASTCDADCLYDPDCPMREDIERDMRELGVDE